MFASVRDPNVTHKIMSAIKSKNTQPELVLRKALWHKNMRYRVNLKGLQGKPDIVFTKYRLVIFVDGDFWHGHNWALRGMNSFEEELEGYSDYWKIKLLRNVERDRENDMALRARGWTVIRIWESEIKADIDSCVASIEEAIFDNKVQEYDLDLEK